MNDQQKLSRIKEKIMYLGLSEKEVKETAELMGVEIDLNKYDSGLKGEIEYDGELI